MNTLITKLIKQLDSSKIECNICKLKYNKEELFHILSTDTIICHLCWYSKTQIPASDLSKKIYKHTVKSL